jgi:hypothetical protein
MCLTGNGMCKGGKCAAGMPGSTEVCPSQRKRGAEALTSNRRKQDRRTEAQPSQAMLRQDIGKLDRRKDDRRKPGKRGETPVLYSVGAIASASAISSRIDSAANAGSAASVIGRPTTM